MGWRLPISNSELGVRGFHHTKVSTDTFVQLLQICSAAVMTTSTVASVSHSVEAGNDEGGQA